MPTIFSGVENRIAQARERQPEPAPHHPPERGRLAHQATRLTAAVGALNERQEALDAKVNAALSLSVLAATVSLIALTRR